MDFWIFCWPLAYFREGGDSRNGPAGKREAAEAKPGHRKCAQISAKKRPTARHLQLFMFRWAYFYSFKPQFFIYVLMVLGYCGTVWFARRPPAGTKFSFSRTGLKTGGSGAQRPDPALCDGPSTARLSLATASCRDAEPEDRQNINKNSGPKRVGVGLSKCKQL